MDIYMSGFIGQQRFADFGFTLAPADHEKIIF